MSLPGWIQRRLSRVKKNGKFCVTGESQFDEKYLLHPDVSKVLSIAKHIDVSRTSLSSLAGLPYFPHLSTFSADKTKISNFVNFKILKSASGFSFKDTPLSAIPTYKIGIALVVGVDAIGSIDGRIVDRGLKKKCRTYPSFCAELVDRGWIPEFPCPDREKLSEICEEFDVEPVYDEFAPGDLVSGWDFAEGEDGDMELEGRLRRLRKEHEEMIVRGQAMFGIVSDTEKFSDKIAGVFRAHGMKLEDIDDDNLIESIQSLCDITGNSFSHS